MTTSSTGATYLIKNAHTLRIENLLDSATSSISASGLMTQPTNRQVSKATMGMMTELDTKSNKSSSEEPSPSGWMNDSPL